jgi:hypothetical protein
VDTELRREERAVEDISRVGRVENVLGDETERWVCSERCAVVQVMLGGTVVQVMLGVVTG